MTREEAIEVLKDIYNYTRFDTYTTNEARTMAIKALEQEPCDDTVSRGVFEQVMWERNTAIEQLHELGYELGQKIEPCDDCVSRSAVLAIAGDSCLDLDSYEDTKEFCDAIKELPPVLPKHNPNNNIRTYYFHGDNYCPKESEDKE